MASQGALRVGGGALRYRAHSGPIPRADPIPPCGRSHTAWRAPIPPARRSHTAWRSHTTGGRSHTAGALQYRRAAVPYRVAVPYRRAGALYRRRAPIPPRGGLIPRADPIPPRGWYETTDALRYRLGRAQTVGGGSYCVFTPVPTFAAHLRGGLGLVGHVHVVSNVAFHWSKSIPRAL